MILKAGSQADLIIYAPIFGAAFTFLWWRMRDRIDEVQLWRNVRLAIRFFLIAVFFLYSFAKFYRSQFMPIPEFQLDTRLGDLTSMRLLWLYFGHSFAYVLFVGVSQTAGALLLTFRRTATLGAMVLFVVVSNIVFVNYAYDIPVKMPASVFLAMTIFLLLEEFPRLWNTIIMKRTELPPPVSYRPAFSPRIGIPISIIVVLYFAWQTNIKFQRRAESRATTSELLPFGGVWEVDEPGEAGSGTTWDRLVVQSSGYGTVGVGTKIGDEYSQLETVSYSDSLRTFSMTWKDSTDTFSGRYSVDGDTLRLSGIQFGDTLNVKLIRRRFRLEPDRY
ncbi:MAG: hypothetical protein E2O84_08065 [Bacteroidetes bacterium]|nr:MAG: hypothetical protein E2O84_08065 [Bacteroidota bacterium]